ncbi:hypothetical protein [Mycetocola saprophilus]|uniref:hypothetical protein n=1 Tax=Mycetocola saprophilus TaxID=76636 RepID=UPI0004C25E57|nr:hypothetical protein [Mycetocola saprophilus]
MSLKSEIFYAIQCEFPECGELWEGDDYMYSTDPDASRAMEDGWCCPGDGPDSCPAHTIAIDCPASDMTTDAATGERYCGWCEEQGTDQHLVMMPDTWENRLRVAKNRVVRRAHLSLERVQYRLENQISRGNLGAALDRRLVRIFEGSCRTVRPDISYEELSDLRRKEASA